MKKIIFTICMIILLSALAVPTFAIYTNSKNEITSGVVTPKRMVNLQNIVIYLENVITDPTAENANFGSGNAEGLENIHEKYPLYYYIEKKGESCEIDSTGANYGIYITKQMKEASPTCFYTQTASWKIALGKASGGQRTLKWQFSNYDINKYVDYTSEEIQDITVATYEISGIIVNTKDNTVDSSNAIIKQGTMKIEQKTFATGQQVYCHNEGENAKLVVLTQPLKYMILTSGSFTTTDAGVRLENFE